MAEEFSFKVHNVMGLMKALSSHDTISFAELTALAAWPDEMVDYIWNCRGNDDTAGYMYTDIMTAAIAGLSAGDITTFAISLPSAEPKEGTEGNGDKDPSPKIPFDQENKGEGEGQGDGEPGDGEGEPDDGDGDGDGDGESDGDGDESDEDGEGDGEEGDGDGEGDGEGEEPPEEFKMSPLWGEAVSALHEIQAEEAKAKLIEEQKKQSQKTKSKKLLFE